MVLSASLAKSARNPSKRRWTVIGGRHLNHLWPPHGSHSHAHTKGTLLRVSWTLLDRKGTMYSHCIFSALRQILTLGFLSVFWIPLGCYHAGSQRSFHIIMGFRPFYFLYYVLVLFVTTFMLVSFSQVNLNWHHLGRGNPSWVVSTRLACGYVSVGIFLSRACYERAWSTVGGATSG